MFRAGNWWTFLCFATTWHTKGETTVHRITSWLRRLWRDQQGVVQAAEMVLIATVVLLGVMVGLATWRDGINNELADVAQALDDFDQSYTVAPLTFVLPPGLTITIGPFGFLDTDDYCDRGGTTTEHCITIHDADIPDGQDDR